MKTTKKIIKHNRIQNEIWIEETGFPLNTITPILFEELNQLIKNGDIVLTDRNGPHVDIYEVVEKEMVEKETPDNPYIRVQIDIDYNAKMLYLDDDEIQFPELLEWREFATLEGNDETFRTYTMKKEWIPALFEKDSFLRAKQAHLKFERNSRQDTINDCEYEMKQYSQRCRDAKEDLRQIEKELKELPFCKECGEILRYEQPMPVAEKMMYSWTCPECKNSEMRDYKEVK